MAAPRHGRGTGRTPLELDPGARATAVIYPLPTGVLGGVLLEAVIAVGGLVLAAMGITGAWLWWKRRRPR